MNCQRSLRWGAILIAVTAGAVWAGNYQARYEEFLEPQLLRLQLNGMDAGLDMQGSYEEIRQARGGSAATYSEFFVAPTLGLSASGSIYHPNLCQFTLTGTAGYGWEEHTLTQGGHDDRHESWQVRGNYRGDALILAGKPLSGSLYSNYGRNHRETDFFTQSTVDTLGYGAQMGFRNPWLEVTTTYAHTEESVFDIQVPYDTQQDLVSLDSRGDHGRGTTIFNYTFNQYNSSQGAPSTSHSVSLSDNERFGSRDQFSAGASIAASRQEAGAQPEDHLSAGASLGIQHDERLSSGYSLSYDHFEAADFVSQSYVGNASVQHQLYESLFSYLNLFGSSADSTADLNSGYARAFGGNWLERYVKQLGTAHRLTVDASLFATHQDQKSTGQARNEQHTFPTPPALESFFLNQTDVIESTIVVSDSGNLRHYTRGLDYDVFQSGTRTELRRILGGGLPTGATVRVDYSVVPTTAASYETFSESAGVRLDLWRGFWGLYGRATHQDYIADTLVQALRSTRYIAGTDLAWRQWRAGAEYENYEDNYSQYWSTRLFQSSSFTLDAGSSLNFSLSETYTEYQSMVRREEDYRLTSTYYRSFAGSLAGTLQSGIGYRHATDMEQTIAVLRPQLNYTYGQTVFQFSYDFEYSRYTGREERQKHLLTLRVKREF